MSAIFRDLTNLNSLECVYCHKFYVGKQAMWEHISKKHKGENHKSKSVTRTYECPFECGKSFTEKRNLIRHMKSCKANPDL